MMSNEIATTSGDETGARRRRRATIPFRSLPSFFSSSSWIVSLAVVVVVVLARTDVGDGFQFYASETDDPSTSAIEQRNLCESNSWDCSACPKDVTLGRVKGISCSSRKIADLGSGVTVPDVIKKADFSNNAIKKIGFTTFGNMSMLYVLNLGHNDIAKIDDYSFSTGRFTRLRNLLLKENALTNITEYTFFGLDSAEYLDLSGNRIRALAPGCFEPMPKLTRLILRDNPLGSFVNRLQFPAAALTGLAKLKSLHLDGTGISTLPAAALEGTSLVYLDISRNVFMEVPPSLSVVGSTLRELDVSDNPMKSLGATSFSGLGNLRALRINRMKRLRVVGANAFRNMTALAYLSVSSNRVLSTIDRHAFGQTFESKKMSTLALRQNALTTLDKHLVEWNYVDVVDLQENPWSCDCNLRWMLKLKLTRNLADDMKCHRPTIHRGKPVRSLRPGDLVCSFLWNRKKSTTGAEVFLGIVFFASALLIVLKYCRPKPLSAACSCCSPCCRRVASSVKRTLPGAAPFAGYARFGPVLDVDGGLVTVVDGGGGGVGGGGVQDDLEWDDKDLATGVSSSGAIVSKNRGGRVLGSGRMGRGGGDSEDEVELG